MINLTLDDIFEENEFKDLFNDVLEYREHIIEKVGLCFQIRQKSTLFLIFETNFKSTEQDCKDYIDKIQNGVFKI